MAIGVRVSIPDSLDVRLSNSLVIFEKSYCSLRINTTLPIQLTDAHYVAVRKIIVLSQNLFIPNKISADIP